MSNVLSHLRSALIWLVLVLAVAAIGSGPWSLPCAFGQVGDREQRVSARNEAPAFEGDEDDDGDESYEPGLPAPGGGDEDDGDADIDAAPLDGSGGALPVVAAAGPTTVSVSPPGIRPSGGHRRTSERPPRA